MKISYVIFMTLSCPFIKAIATQTPGRRIKEICNSNDRKIDLLI